MLDEISLVPATARPSHWRWLALVLLVVPAVLVRLWLIRHFPEPDADAPGHLGIARALLSDPANVAIHWVYLPAYHFVLAALLLAGLDGEGVRLVNCALAALVPILVLRYGKSSVGRADSGPSRNVPWMAAAFCALSPLVNLLGTSAQQETLFTILVICVVWSIDAKRFLVGGVLLALASLIRYEAWGAVALVAGLQVIGRFPPLGRRLPSPVRRASRLPLVITAPAIVAIGAWLLAHRLRDGQWFGFLRELYRYTHVQRESLHRSALWFPIQQPLFIFGSVVAVLFFAGLRRAWRPSYAIPLGVYLFLIGAYVFKGALGSARYYESLTPFVAFAAAQGICVLGERWRWLTPCVFLVASLQLVALSVQLFLWTWPTQASMLAQRYEGRSIARDGGHQGAKPRSARAFANAAGPCGGPKGCAP